MRETATESVGRGTPLSRLASMLELCQPLMASSRAPLRVFPGEHDAGSAEAEAAAFDAEAVARCNEVLTAIGGSRGWTTPQFVWPAPAQPSSLEVALSNFFGLEPGTWRSIAASPGGPSLASEVHGIDLAAPPDRRRIHAAGLPSFESFARGQPGDEAIIIIPPCGVPAELFRPWLAALSARYLVVTYENPYLFGAWAALPVPAGELATEAAYVGAILEAYGISRAHLVGICGGAPIALAAAAELGPKVASMIVCHADLNFGAQIPRSPFQKQFQGFLFEAGANLERAREVLDLFLDPNMLFGVPTRLAPFILYPYGDLGLFHRYAKINYGLMAYDASDAARRLDQRLLIITSRTDRMTHPAASHHLHRTVNGSTLEERAKGSHHDILLPNPELFAAIHKFVDGGAGAAEHGGRA